MNQNSQLKTEYFELSKLLITSNLKIDQKTEICFFIEVRKGNLTLFATTNKISSLKLIYQHTKSTWRPCGYTRFKNLEEHLTKLASKNNLELLNSNELTRLIKSFIFQHSDE